MLRRKKHSILILLLIILVAIPIGPGQPYEVSAAVIGVVTAGELYVRSGPATTYQNILIDGEKVILVKNQEVTIVGVDDGWYQINAVYKGNLVEGYSLGTYIAVSKEDLSEIGENITPVPSVVTPVPTTAVTPAPTEKPTPTPTEKLTPTQTPKPTQGIDPSTDPEQSDVGENNPEIPDEEGYIFETITYDADYDHKGKVTAELLNMRMNPDSGADVITTLPAGTEVVIIKSTMKTQKINDVETSIRWYKIITEIDGETVPGYVMSDYVKVDLSEPIAGRMKYKKQLLHKSASLESAVIKTSKGAKVRLAKSTVVSITKEVTKNGVKWYRITADYKGETIKGYLQAGRIAFVNNVTEYVVKVRVEDEKLAEVTQIPADDEPLYNMPGANALIIDAAALAIKAEPSYASDTLMTAEGRPVLLYSGDSVEVLDTNASGDIVWCYCRMILSETEYKGYINSRYIKSDTALNLMSNNTETNASELSFEAKLDKEGFDESYKEKLRVLHEIYPNWQFKAYNTGLDWNNVIQNQIETGKNLIPNTKGVEWKSLEEGAYRWKTDTFVVFDGSTWVTASKEAIEYYMDPRNFLDANTIFQFEVLAYNPSYQNAEGVGNILRNTAMADSTYTYDDYGILRDISFSDTFLMAAEYSGVSPFHLASRVKQEVTLGTTAMSNSVTGTVSGYEGLYNYYNIGAYHSTEVGGAIANGLRFSRDGSSNQTINLKCLIPWNNRFRSILGGAYYIGCNYINKGQDTIYLQKFNVTPTNTFKHQYMANVEAAFSEGKRVFSGYEDPGSIPIIFSIPIFQNMPVTPCTVPQPKLNPNNWLKSLKIYNINGDKLSLTPTFSQTADCEYNMIVDSNIDYLKLKTSTISSLAKVVSENTTYLSTGLNKVTVQVQAQNGDIREYIINVVREEETQGPENSTVPEAEITQGPENSTVPEAEITQGPENSTVPETEITQGPENSTVPETEITQGPENSTASGTEVTPEHSLEVTPAS